MDDFARATMRLTGYMMAGGVLCVLLGLLAIAATGLDNQVAGSIIGGSTALIGAALGGCLCIWKERD